jgi:hypothetical protein
MLKKIKKIIKKKKTLLGVGPMSLNCVNSAIDVSNKFNIPLLLIASRRQIDSKIFGGGYVNKWNTEEFSRFISIRDKKKNIIICRDHGGPWQNNLEVKNQITWSQALTSAKKSFECDIDNNFNILHIDTSEDIHKKISKKIALNRFFELFEHCIWYSSKKKKKIYFEIGTEEQSGSTNTPYELYETLSKIKNFCKNHKADMPLFVVIQSGTKVLEMRNVGSFESPLRVKGELAVEIQLPKMIEICNKFKILMKEHNADYLSNESLSWHPMLGIHAANVAPEFGVTETKALLGIMRHYNLNGILQRFLNLSFKSYKWKKWMIPGSKATDYDKSVIAGHYVFSTKEFFLIKEELNNFLMKKKINLNKYLQSYIKFSILRYAKGFNLIR